MPVQSLEHLSAKALFPPIGVPVHVNRPIHNGTVPLHDHDFIELVFMLEGHAIHRTIHGETAINSGDVFVLHPGQWHSYERCNNLTYYNCLLGVELLTREFAWVRSDPLLSPLFPSRLPAVGSPPRAASQGVLTLRLDPQALATCVGELESLRALQTGDDLVRARPEIIGRLLLLLSTISRAVAQSPATRSVRGGEADPNVLKAIQALEERLEHDWGLVELSKLLVLNRSYLVRLFKRHTGQSPMAWLARRRAEKAAVLLLTTDQPVAAVGRAVGWHDPNYFARRFRAAFGISAREYRQQLPCPALVREADDWIQW